MGKLSHSLEDYLETIYILSLEKESVRVKDLVSSMKVKSASVIGAIKKLEEKGLVEHAYYGDIIITANGRERARQIYDKHQTLLRFINEILTVNRRTAEEDACRIEHYISEETHDKIMKFMRFIESQQKSESKWLEALKRYLKSNTTG
jgi:DtxR family Mn-dependent transcriptional regulator